MGVTDVSGASDDAKNLANFLDGVLEKVITTYDSYSMPLPARRYWTMGSPAIDCEQLTVHLLQMYLGPPGDEVVEPRRCSDPRTATINITVSREIPTVGQSGNPPSPTNIEKGSTVAAYDAWILMESINEFDQWDPTGFGLGVIATLEVDEPEGGFQTVRLVATMAVP